MKVTDKQIRLTESYKMKKNPRYHRILKVVRENDDQEEIFIPEWFKVSGVLKIKCEEKDSEEREKRYQEEWGEYS